MIRTAFFCMTHKEKSVDHEAEPQRSMPYGKINELYNISRQRFVSHVLAAFIAYREQAILDLNDNM